MRKSLFITVLVLFSLVLSSVSWAQEATPEASLAVSEPGEIFYNTPVNGQLDNANFAQTWTLTTGSADRIDVLVERADGNLIPDVSILDANGQIITQAFGADETGSVSSINSYTLPSAGTYQIQVGRENTATGQTTGTYRLTIVPRATAQDNINNRTEVAPIEADAPVTGEITATHWYQRYTYTAPAGDTIFVTMRRTSGTLFPQIDVLDVNGQPISNGYVDYTGDYAETNFTQLPAAGTYTIVATRDRAFNGDTVGGYELTVNLIGSGAGSPNLANPAGTISYDTPLAGTITGAEWYQDWVLVTEAGDTLSITVDRDMTEAGNNLQPEVSLLGAAGQEIQHGYTESRGDFVGARAQIEHVTLVGPGTYTVRVLRSGGQSRGTTGSYILNVELYGSGVGSPNLVGEAGAVTLSEPAEGTLNGTKWIDTWTFENPIAQPLVYTVTRTAGNLIPLFEIQDTNGQVIANPYYERTRDVVRYETFSPVLPGTYRIVVFRDRRQEGATSGDYRLTIQPPEQ